MKFKYLLSISITIFLITIFGIATVAYASITKLPDTPYTKVSIDEILVQYNLKNKDLLRENETNFLKYYKALIKNKSLDEEIRKFYLNFFEYFIDYIEIINMDVVTNNLATFKLLLPDKIDSETKKEASLNSIAAKTIYDDGLRIEIYTYNDEEDFYRILTHESFHLFSNFGNWSLVSDLFIKQENFYAYDYLNPPLNIKNEELHRNVGWIFLEATTELLTNEYNVFDSYKVYQNEVLALKILIEIISKDVLITSFNKKNGIVDILNEINKIDNRPHELLELISETDKKTLAISDNNIINYYRYFEYLASIAELKYNKPLLELPLELRTYFDLFKKNLISSNLRDRLDELKDISLNTSFYLYICDEKYLLNNSIMELKDINITDIEINKKYYKTKLDEIYEVKVTYRDSKNLEIKTISYPVNEKSDQPIAFYISRKIPLPLNGSFLSILSTNNIPFK